MSSSAPRHPSHLGPNASNNVRPAFSPRSSSLNVSPKLNNSATSLNSLRLGGGSGLRQEILPPPDVRDPLGVLEDVIGKTLRVDEGKTLEIKKPEVMIEDVEFGCLGLDEFLLGQDPGDQKPKTMRQTAEEYEKDMEKFEDLHRSILACDDVLKSVEISLASFQKDLRTVSAEIETLQSRSTGLNTKIGNRKVVEKLLGPAVEEISIEPAVVQKLSEGLIDQDWIAALGVLSRRLKSVEEKLKGNEKIVAVADIKPLLDDLTNLVIARIRDYFVTQIKALRSPNINAQVIQQRAFVAYKDLYKFLSEHHPKLAEEIGQAYSNTMRWYYLSNFSRYKQALERIALYTVDKVDALGSEQTSQRGTTVATSNAPQRSPNPLSLGRRLDLVTRPPNTALPSYIATETKSPAYTETPFHAFSTALIDNASTEYNFLTTFFPATTKFPSLSRTFNNIFSPTFEMGLLFTKQLIENTYDCLGLLLCVRITQHHAFLLQRRKCPVADSWINGTNMLLWPRFQVGMDAHIESVKRATTTLSSSSRATLSITSTKAVDAKGSTAPHPLTQRFGQLLQGILALSNNDPTNTKASTVERAATSSGIEPIGRSLERLRSEVEAFLTKAAKGSSQGRKERFLGNNYSLILTIIGDTGGSLAREQRSWFEDRRDSLGGG
ncbi:MAG: hypothetical protein Q9163_001020 [Psora crenata]